MSIHKLLCLIVVSHSLMVLPIIVPQLRDFTRHVEVVADACDYVAEDFRLAEVSNVAPIRGRLSTRV